MLACAVHLRETGHTIAQIVVQAGITRTSLYRHMSPRPAPQVTAAETEPEPGPWHRGTGRVGQGPPWAKASGVMVAPVLTG